MSPKIRAAISFLNTNLHRVVTTEELADSVKLSRSRYSHLFKLETGMPPTHYLRRIRMNRACELLETSFMSVKEIAAEVGYNDGAHFMRDFKRTYGATPSQHRDQFVNTPELKRGHPTKNSKID
ncbi:MAG: helix-turn-helix domain-containing protein [Acidobacteriota bacterium]